MNYGPMLKASFLSRPNRFVAYAELNGETVVCHVKNTGRCRELLIPGVTVYLKREDNPARKTPFSLIHVQKGERLINIDSQAPNKVAGEWLQGGGLFPKGALIRPETKYGGSRFDFYIESGARKAFLEVKGVTLEENGAVSFPDAPTERGAKHLRELCQCVKDGYEAYVLFVVQMQGVSYFMANGKNDPAFAAALLEARDAGVTIMAMDCVVEPDRVTLHSPVEVRL